MSEFPEAIKAPADNVGEDLPCRGCGYNLRALPLSASCPECGVPVAWSIRDHQLVNANPIWLKRLRTGVGLLMLTIPLRALLILLTQYGGLLGLQIVDPFAMGPLSLVLDSSQAFLMVVLAIACLVLTTPEPGLAPLERDNLLRKRLRIVAVVYVVFALSNRVIWSLLGLQFSLVSVIPTSIKSVILVAGAYCLFTYLAALVDRTPTRRGAGLIRVLRYIYLPIMAIGEIADLFFLWAWFAPPPALPGPGRMLPIRWLAASGFLLSPAAGLIAVIIFVVFLARFHFDLDRIWKQASAGWSEREA